MVHKLKGAAGSLALMMVWRNATNLEQTLRQGKDEGPQVQTLLAALAAAHAAIAVVTCADAAVPAVAAPDNTSTSASCLLDDLLVALDRDDLDDAESILDRLSGKLPADQLAALLQRVDSFDFRGAEAIAHSLAAGLANVPANEASIAASPQ